MTASHDFFGQLRVSLDGLARHVGGDFDAVPVPEVKHARDALAPPYSNQVRAGRSGYLASMAGKGDPLVCSLCAPASNGMETEITRRTPSGQNLPGVRAVATFGGAARTWAPIPSVLAAATIADVRSIALLDL